MGQAGTRDHGLLGGHIGGLVLQGRRVLVDGCLLRGGLDQAQRDLRGVGRRIVEDLDLHALGFRRPHQHQVAADTVDVGDRIEGDGNLLVIGAAGTGEDQVELLKVELVPTAVKWVGATIPRSTLVTLPAPGA